MRLCFGILRIPNSPGCPYNIYFETNFNHCTDFEDRNCGICVSVGNFKYNKMNIGSISFMNVIIEDDKKYIATYPIFMFYLFIDWFVLFI